MWVRVRAYVYVFLGGWWVVSLIESTPTTVAGVGESVSVGEGEGEGEDEGG